MKNSSFPSKPSIVDWIHLLDFWPFFPGRLILRFPVCFSAHHDVSNNEFTLKEKNLYPVVYMKRKEFAPT